MQNIERIENTNLCEGIDLSPIFGGKESLRFIDFVNNKSDDLLDIFNSIIAPRLYYRNYKIASSGNGSVYLEKGVELKSIKLAKVMKHCESAICFTATIGSEVDKEISRLTYENRLFDAYLIDSMGSMAVENMAEEFWKGMQTRYNALGRGITLRFSPGYCDWPIVEQKKLFDQLFDAGQTDVKLTDSCLMNPRKSISGIFGIHPLFNEDGPVSPYNPCSDCNKKNCKERRVCPANS